MIVMYKGAVLDVDNALRIIKQDVETNVYYDVEIVDENDNHRVISAETFIDLYE